MKTCVVSIWIKADSSELIRNVCCINKKNPRTNELFFYCETKTNKYVPDV